MADPIKTNVTFSGLPLIDPRSIFQAGAQHGWDTSWFGLPTSYVCPIGKQPGRGWVFLSRKQTVALDKNSSHDLKFFYGNVTTTFKSLYVVQARAVYFGPSRANANTAHDDVAYLVELSDCRRLFWMTSLVKAFNVRRPAPHQSPTAVLTPEKCYVESLNGTSLWTWETLCTHLWSLLPSAAGAFPGLPQAVAIHPEGFRFFGVSVWDALHVVLDKLGLAVRYNPLTATFSIVNLEDGQLDFNTNINGLSDFRMADHNQLSGNKATCPYKINVCFHRREDHYGTEAETPGIDNWESESVYMIPKLTGIANTDQKTALTVWDDTPALAAFDGMISNDAVLQSRASALAQQISNRISNRLIGQRSAYFGIHTSILPGSEIGYVKWCDDGFSGMYTEYGADQAPFPPAAMSGAAGPGTGTGGSGGLASPAGLSALGLFEGPLASAYSESGIFPSRENLAAPDFSRHSHPIYPKLTQLVEVDKLSASDPKGKSLPRNAAGLWAGVVVRLNPDANLKLDSAVSAVELCWLWAEDLTGGSLDAAGTLQVGDRFNGRLNGSATADGSTRPLYLIRKGGSSKVEGIPFYNEHFSTSPYGAIMQARGVIDIQGVPHLRITQPAPPLTNRYDQTDVARLYVVNKSGPVAYQETGLASIGPFVEVLCSDFAAANRTCGDQWGPIQGSWALKESIGAGGTGTHFPFWSNFGKIADDPITGHALCWCWAEPINFMFGQIRNSSASLKLINKEDLVQVEIGQGPDYVIWARNKMSQLVISAATSGDVLRRVFLQRRFDEWWITAFEC